MRIYYKNICNSGDKEFLANVNTPEELAEFILSFLNDHGFKVYYFRLCDFNNGEIMIDFGSHIQFYYIENCEYSLRDLANRMHIYKEQFYNR